MELPSRTFNKFFNVLGLAVYQVIWSGIYSLCNCWKNKYSLLCSSWCRPRNASIRVPLYIRKSLILSGFQLLLFLNCFTLLQHIPSKKVAFVASYHSSLNALCIVVMCHSSLNPPVRGRAHLCPRFSLRSSSSKWCYYKVLAHGEALRLCIYVLCGAAFNASGTLRLACSPLQYWSRRVLPLLCSLVPLFFSIFLYFFPSVSCSEALTASSPSSQCTTFLPAVIFPGRTRYSRFSKAAIQCSKVKLALKGPHIRFNHSRQTASDCRAVG